MENLSINQLHELAHKWTKQLEHYLNDAVSLRKKIHASPRVSGDELDTKQLVEEAMQIELSDVAETGGITRFGPEQGPAVGLRGELDALPVQEQTGVDYASTNEAMHACGHDIHLAALVAVVRAAKDLPLPFAIAPFLQPREETYPSGAKDIAESGHFAELNLGAAIGAHVHPGLDSGQVAAGSGFVNAAAGEVIVEIAGAGGHGAYPHNAQDTAVCTAQIVTGLSEILRRTSDPMSPAVLSVGTISVGDGAANVLPGKGLIKATVRSTSQECNREISKAVKQFAKYTARSFECTADVSYIEGEPALINDDILSSNFKNYAEHNGLETSTTMRSLGADDFSFYGELVPSLMCFVGVDEERSLHDPRFLPSEDAIRNVAVALISGYLSASQMFIENNSQ
ncbi:M20 metallopeptidase family protein [Corynebacterium propinquum]